MEKMAKRTRKSPDEDENELVVAVSPTSKKRKPKESSKITEPDLTNGSHLLEILKNDHPPFGSLPFDSPIWSSLVVGAVSESGQQPKLLILCGPPGCGKSTVKIQLLIQYEINTYINIDPDEIRTILMHIGVRFVNKKGVVDDKIMSGVTNAYNKRICDEALKQRLHIVFDTTGQNFGAISELTRITDYTKIFTVIWASKSTCIRRIVARNIELAHNPDGRIELPTAIASNIYNGFMRPQTDESNGTASMFLISKYKIINKVDEVLLYNNDADGKEPVLLFNKNRAVGVVPPTVKFERFYNMKLNTDDPFIRPRPATELLGELESENERISAMKISGKGNPLNNPKKTRTKPRKKHTNKFNINKSSINKSRRKRVIK